MKKRGRKPSNILNLDRFWLIYLGCLEKPRSIKELSFLYGFIDRKNNPKPNLYQYQLANRMVKEGYLKISHLCREVKYYSKLNILDKKKINFFNKEWVKKELFSFENIMIFFNNDIELIKRRGGEFIDILVGILTLYTFPHQKDRFFLPGITFGVSSAFGRLGVMNYIKKVAKVISDHKNEIIKAFEIKS